MRLQRYLSTTLTFALLVYWCCRTLGTNFFAAAWRNRGADSPARPMA